MPLHDFVAGNRGGGHSHEGVGGENNCEGVEDEGSHEDVRGVEGEDSHEDVRGVEGEGRHHGGIGGAAALRPCGT